MKKAFILIAALALTACSTMNNKHEGLYTDAKMTPYIKIPKGTTYAFKSYYIIPKAAKATETQKTVDLLAPY